MSRKKPNGNKLNKVHKCLTTLRSEWNQWHMDSIIWDSILVWVFAADSRLNKEMRQIVLFGSSAALTHNDTQILHIKRNRRFEANNKVMFNVPRVYTDSTRELELVTRRWHAGNTKKTKQWKYAPKMKKRRRKMGSNNNIIPYDLSVFSTCENFWADKWNPLAVGLSIRWLIVSCKSIDSGNLPKASIVLNTQLLWRIKCKFIICFICDNENLRVFVFVFLFIMPFSNDFCDIGDW